MFGVPERIASLSRVVKFSRSFIEQGALDNFTSSLDSAAIRVWEQDTPVCEPPSEHLIHSVPSNKNSRREVCFFVWCPGEDSVTVKGREILSFVH